MNTSNGLLASSLHRADRDISSVPRVWPNDRAEWTGRKPTDGEQVLTFVPAGQELPAAFVERFVNAIRHQEGSVLMVMAYGSISAYAAVMEQLAGASGKIEWPVLWVEGASCHGGPLAGFQVFILPGGEIQRIRIGRQVVGSVFSDGDARHCLLAGLMPPDALRGRAQQCAEFFKCAEKALEGGGFTFGDIARTWFYNDEILAWYDDFNCVRTAYYTTQKFRSGSLPASTAVRGRNPLGAALTFGAWAMVPNKQDSAAMEEVASPLQCPAPAYGSSFSRAMEITSSGRKRLLVSGTASIEPGGKTVWQGDTEKQIALTMDVVEAILKPRGFGLNDVTRATAYFRNAGDSVILQRWLASRGLQAMPVVPVHCDICRDDLLFEIELDACVVG